MIEAYVRVLSIEPDKDFTVNTDEDFGVMVTVQISADEQHIQLKFRSLGRPTLNQAVSNALSETVEWVEQLRLKVREAEGIRPMH